MISILASLDVSFFLKLYQFEIKVSLYQWGEQSYGLGRNFGLQNGLTSCNIFRLTTGISHKVWGFWNLIVEKMENRLASWKKLYLAKWGEDHFYYEHSFFLSMKKEGSQ